MPDPFYPSPDAGDINAKGRLIFERWEKRKEKDGTATVVRLFDFNIHDARYYEPNGN
jgi:hypothetical protein